MVLWVCSSRRPSGLRGRLALENDGRFSTPIGWLGAEQAKVHARPMELLCFWRCGAAAGAALAALTHLT